MTDDSWAIYESNVQAYRGLALNAQGFFLAVGAILMDNDSRLAFFGVGIMAAVATWWIFFPAIFARTAIVDFHKYRLGSRVGPDGELDEDGGLDEHAYARAGDGTLRKRVYAAARRHERETGERADLPIRTLRLTRLKLDLALPAIFQITWVVLAVAELS